MKRIWYGKRSDRFHSHWREIGVETCLWLTFSLVSWNVYLIIIVDHSTCIKIEMIHQIKSTVLNQLFCFQIEVLYAKNSKTAGKLNLHPTATIADVKVQMHKLASHLYVERQSIRLEARGKALKDSDTLQNLNLRAGGKLYLKDLGPQIGWTTVFLCEYAGPLIVYLLVYQRPWLFYGDVSGAPYHLTAQWVTILCVVQFECVRFSCVCAFEKIRRNTRMDTSRKGLDAFHTK